MDPGDREETVLWLLGTYFFGYVYPVERSSGGGHGQQWDELADLVRRLDWSWRKRTPPNEDTGSKSDEFQNRVVERLDRLHPGSRFPVLPRMKLELRRWVEGLLLEELGWPRLEALDNFLDLSDKEPVGQEPFLFKTFEVVEGCPVTLIEENNDKMGRGTTGLVTWQGSLALTQWAVEFFPWFVGGAKMSLLELGSGIGLFGLTAAKLGHSVTFTDSHPMVLDFIKANIRINLDAPEAIVEEDLQGWLDRGPPLTPGDEPFQFDQVRVEKLDWTLFDPDDVAIRFKDVDVVVASDAMGGAPRSQVNRAAAFIACTQRKVETVKAFLDELNNQGLLSEVVYSRAFSPSDCSMVISHEPLRKVTVYKVTIKD